MSRPVRGYLTDTNVFFKTKDEADYYELCLALNTQVRGMADAFEVPQSQHEGLVKFISEYIKLHGPTIVALHECYQRLHPRDEVVGQLDEGGEGLREPVRSGDIGGVAEVADAEDTSEPVKEEDGNTNEVLFLRSQPSGEGEATEAVVGSKYKKGDRPAGWHPDHDKRG